MSLKVPVVMRRDKALKAIRKGSQVVVIKRGGPTDSPARNSWSAVVCANEILATAAMLLLSNRRPLRSRGNRGRKLRIPTLTVIGLGEEVAHELEQMTGPATELTEVD